VISRKTRIQLVAFVVLAVVGIAYVGMKYAGLGNLLGSSTYTVTMKLADTGGIFTNAEVTYRGVDVGRVGALHLTEQGADVELKINKDAPKIPAEGLRAEVKNLSIIGELYVDLTPATMTGPQLRDGSVIDTAQTQTPVAPATLLAQLNRFLKSVPADQTGVVLHETSEAFAGGGASMARLLDSSSDLIKAAQQSLGDTKRLISDGAVVLRTQNATGNDVLSFSHSLDLLAKTLKSSDSDLNRLIATAPMATTQLSDLLRESGPGFSRLVADLLTTSRLLDPRGDALRQLLIVYPALARAAYSALPGDGYAHFGLVVNAFDPPPCTRGYESTTRHAGTYTGNPPVNSNATCAEPSGSPIAVRGTQNAPHHGVPDAVPYPGMGSSNASSRLSWGTTPGDAKSPADILTGGL